MKLSYTTAAIALASLSAGAQAAVPAAIQADIAVHATVPPTFKFVPKDGDFAKANLDLTHTEASGFGSKELPVVLTSNMRHVDFVFSEVEPIKLVGEVMKKEHAVKAQVRVGGDGTFKEISKTGITFKPNDLKFTDENVSALTLKFVGSTDKTARYTDADLYRGIAKILVTPAAKSAF